MKTTTGLEHPRVYLLDELRGIWLILMIVYHALYDLVYLFDIPVPGFTGPAFRVFQRIIVGGFILLSGLVSRYSRSSLRRGLLVLVCGMVLTVTTSFAMPTQVIYFGVLHFMGTAMILFGLLRPLLDRVKPSLGAVLSLLLFAFTWRLPSGTVGFGEAFSVSLPTLLYQTPFLFPLGFPNDAFFSADYVPILPWFFFFLAGSYLSIFLQKGKMPGFFYKPRLPLLSKIGSKTIWIYMIHQPVIYGLLWIFLH
ncbi:heparan-alpha-glucosaminide N-acetyltransferase [Oscillospiraceae bacterium MB08-C2-2]|nr:heparan-alpha-glucosaminide N-acetyltransferase [Oscillospiraceae bacterium MB08-C2-2]